MYAYISCIHILAWYRKKFTLYLSTLFGQPCYQPRRWKIQSLELLELSSVAFQNISKICSKVAPPPVSLAFSLVPGAKNAAKKPKEDESCCNSQRFTVKWRRCESFCRQNGPEIFTFWSLEKDRNEMPSSREKYNLGQILTTWMEFYCVLQRTLLWGGTWQGSLWIMKRPYQIAWHPIAHSMLSGTFTCPYTKLLNFSAEEVLNK